MKLNGIAYYYMQDKLINCKKLFHRGTDFLVSPDMFLRIDEIFIF